MRVENDLGEPAPSELRLGVERAERPVPMALDEDLWRRRLPVGGRRAEDGDVRGARAVVLERAVVVDTEDLLSAHRYL